MGTQGVPHPTVPQSTAKSPGDKEEKWPGWHLLICHWISLLRVAGQQDAVSPSDCRPSLNAVKVCQGGPTPYLGTDLREPTGPFPSPATFPSSSS